MRSRRGERHGAAPFFMDPMPAGIKNDALWLKAKKQIEPTWGDQENPWAVVMQRYKDLGGEADKAAEEACASGQMGALMRGQESGWQGDVQKFVSFREASFDSKTRTVKTILVTEGPGNQRDRNYYTPQFIESAVRQYEGARAYLNHASESEYRNRPEGDVRELFGFYRNLHVIQMRDKQTGQMVAACAGDLVVDESRAGKDAMAKIEAQIAYSQIFPDSPEEYCGLSISGSGIREGQLDFKGQKWNRIVGVGQADSVDMVTRPARGGAFLALIESAGPALNLPKEEAIMLKKLMAITADITEATKRMSEAKTEEERAAAKADLESLRAKLTEAAKDGEGDEASKKKAREEAEAKAAKAKEADDDTDGLANLKKLMPKDSEESDEAYGKRLSKIKAAVSKGQESMGGLTADYVRKNHPRVFEAIAARVRESMDDKSEDIADLKRQLREAKTELSIVRDKDLAVKLLSEAGVPAKILNAGDLIGMSQEEMEREIERAQALMESIGGRTFIPQGAKGGTQGSSKLQEAIKKLKDKAIA